jgi:hypothetical protein
VGMCKRFCSRSVAHLSSSEQGAPLGGKPKFLPVLGSCHDAESHTVRNDPLCALNPGLVVTEEDLTDGQQRDGLTVLLGPTERFADEANDRVRVLGHDRPSGSSQAMCCRDGTPAPAEPEGKKARKCRRPLPAPAGHKREAAAGFIAQTTRTGNHRGPLAFPLVLSPGRSAVGAKAPQPADE